MGNIISIASAKNFDDSALAYREKHLQNNEAANEKIAMLEGFSSVLYKVKTLMDGFTAIVEAPNNLFDGHDKINCLAFQLEMLKEYVATENAKTDDLVESLIKAHSRQKAR